MLQQRPNTFAQTNLSPSFFLCDKAADHTSGLPVIRPQLAIASGAFTYAADWIPFS
jgi:hypothetical protein